MPPEILILTPLYGPTMKELERRYRVHRLWEHPDPKGFLTRSHPAIRAVVTTGVVGFRQEHIANLPSLEIVSAFGVAHGTLDLAAARQRGIAVTNTPDSSADTVADLALGLVIAVMRRIAEADRWLRAGEWRKQPFPMAASLKGKVCGILGLGNIGRGIARRAQAFDMEVRYSGPRRKPDVPYHFDPDPVALAAASDCLVVACPIRPETRGLVDARVLKALGPEGFLVNIARGEIIDQPVLVEALRTGAIAGAALDVFVDEPAVPPALIELTNVVLTPHIGTSTREIREERSQLLLANLEAHFSGRPLITPL